MDVEAPLPPLEDAPIDDGGFAPPPMDDDDGFAPGGDDDDVGGLPRVVRQRREAVVAEVHGPR